MTEYLVGTGGWAYFKVPNKPSLKAYSETFNFVEVNNTFYQYPSIRAVETWRKIVPENFTFSVRCHNDLTHKIGLRPVDEAYHVLYRMRTYCEILKSPYLVLETPSRYLMSQENINEAKQLFSSLNMKGVRLVWEIRAPLTQPAINLMQDLNIIHCVDLSNQKPSYNSDVTYSRLFGKGQHNIYQFTDDELAEIDQKTQDTKAKIVALSYHGLRMNTDAIRFKQYKLTGTFLPATSATGVDSAKAVLAEDSKFPSSRSQLQEKQGWKVIDASNGKTAHLSNYLSKIPDKKYYNLEEVLNELKAVL